MFKVLYTVTVCQIITNSLLLHNTYINQPTQAKIFSIFLKPRFSNHKKINILYYIPFAPVNKRPAQTLHDELNQHIAVKGCTRLTIIVPFPHPTLSSFISTNFHNTHAELSVFGFTWLKIVKFPGWIPISFLFILSFQQGKYLRKTHSSESAYFSLPALSSFFLADH